MTLQESVEIMQRQTERDITAIYDRALKAAIRNAQGFFRAAQRIDSGKVKPPSEVRTDKQLAAWKEASLRRLARTGDVYGAISSELRAAGQQSRTLIVSRMADLYADARRDTFDALHAEGYEMPTKRQIVSRLYGKENGDAASRIALNHLRNGRSAASMVRRALSEGFRKGDTKTGLIVRIRDTVRKLINTVLRILRTETTKTRGKGQDDAAREHQRQTGQMLFKRWICIFVNSRETHMDLHKQVVPYNFPFVSPSGATLMYPGDPSAPIEEVINCQCHMEVFGNGTTRTVYTNRVRFLEK